MLSQTSCEFFQVVSSLSKGSEPFSIVTVMKGNKKIQEGYRVIVSSSGKILFGTLFEYNDKVKELSLEAIRNWKSFEANVEELRVKIEPVMPRPSLVLVGSGEIVYSLAKLSKDLGYNVAVIGNRDLKEEKFNFVDFISNELEVLDQVIDNESIVVIANEGGKEYDWMATFKALKKGAKYVGLLASQKRAAATIARMLREGLEEEKLKNLYSPIGIDIGAKSSEEIALSCLAEIVKIIRNGSGRHMRDVKNPMIFLKDAMEGKISESCAFSPVSLTKES